MQVALLLLLSPLLASILPNCASVPCPPVNRTDAVRFVAVNETTPHVACPTSLPTQVVPHYVPVIFQCCAAGAKTIEWFYAVPENPFAFSEKLKFRNQTELNLSIADNLDTGFYKCRLTGWNGKAIERTQRLVVVKSDTVGDVTNTSFQENCRESALLRPASGDNAALTCTVRTCTTPGSFLELRLIKDGVHNISSCFIRPLCIRLEPEKYQDQSQDIALSTCSPPGKDVKLRVILQSTGPEVEVQIEVRNVRKYSKWQLIAWDGRNPAISTSFRIQPQQNLLLWWHFLMMAVAISVFLTAGFWSVFLGWRDIQLLFSKSPPPTAQRERIRVVLLSSDTSEPITAELANQLIAHLGRHFAVSRRFLPDFTPPLAGTATTADLAAAGANCLSVVLLDGASFRSDLFVGKLKALLMRPGAMRVYVAMEMFRQMRRTNHTEFVARLTADSKYHPLVRSHWRPTDWVLRQVRLAMEQERRAGLRKRGLAMSVTASVTDADVEVNAASLREKMKKLQGRRNYSTL